MVKYVLVLLTSLAARSWADELILTQIASSSDCNSDKLFGDFDLKTVPQFDALCNIPVPEIQHSEFLLKNNVVPILCMGLLDVSLRLCKSAKNDDSQFKDFFPPTSYKFNKNFDMLRKSPDFSLLDEFCTTTVNKFAVKEAASNATELWWKVLSKQLGDVQRCSNICHSNVGSKVHPLCSYILWSNKIYITYQNNQAVRQAASAGEDQKSFIAQKVEEVANQAGKSNQVIESVKNDPIAKPTEVGIGSDLAPLSSSNAQIAEGTKANFTTDNNIVGVGTVEQVINNGDQSAVAHTVKVDVNPSPDQVKLLEIGDKPKSKHQKIKEAATTSTPTGNSKAEVGSIIQEKLAPSTGQTEVKVDLKENAAVVSEPGNAKGAPVVPDLQKQGEAKQGPGPESGKFDETMDEGDLSPEVTPEGDGLDQPIPADKDLQPPFTGEEGEDGDGDDVDFVESNAQANTNTASNSSNPATSKTSNTGVESIQQGPLEGDKMYGEAGILIEDHFIEAEDSHFFTYFLCMAVLTIMAYLAFHNKKKLIALAVEGRRTKGGRRRPNSSHYSKLDCSLEEALVSNTTASVTHVLY